ncbi:MAG: UDP-N-acetylmuramoyl-tripeptide--D-alanyl-D-alanine ligase [Bacteroidales bacterium]|nr:UDP-N-acetylmuramoyl-tripeptide--D-alanyl-D-alanine ligase [Bacteroidales bacterium]
MDKMETLYAAFLKSGSVSIDSRKIAQGSLFFALKGENTDGNRFVQKALEAGAAIAVADDPKIPEQKGVVKVESSLKALQELAKIHRKNLKAKVIGITGSNGKTTSKELISRVLNQKYKVAFTQGNLNNHIGVPLSILQIAEDTEIAIIEMGANHQGEIAELSRIAQPHFGLITNIGKAHLEGFGSLIGVINAKSELYSYIDDHNGMLFVNTSNPLLAKLSANIKRFTYGEEQDSQVYGELIAADPYLTFVYEYQNRQALVETKLIGNYNFENLLAAAAIGSYFEVEQADIVDALASYKSSNSRSQQIDTAYNKLVMDAYNANPVSMQAAIKNFDRICGKRSAFILGDMLELGSESDYEHAEILKLLTDLDCKNVFLVGPLFGRVYAGDDWLHFKHVDDLVKHLQDNPLRGFDMLLKGSRGIQLEKVLAYL